MNIQKNMEGFSLIEALIAMLVLSIGILSVSTMQISSVKGNTTANKVSVASAGASSGYELLLNVPYNATALSAGAHIQDELPGLVIPRGVSSITWDVTEWTNTDLIDNDGDGVVDEADEVGIKSIDLNVNYSDRSAKTLIINFFKSEML